MHRMPPSLFSTHVVVSSAVLDLTILCTFGIVSPYLGTLVCISLCCTFFQWRIFLYRYAYHMSRENKSDYSLLQLNIAAANTFEISFMQLWVFITCTTSVLFFIFCIDMISDSNYQASIYYVCGLVIFVFCLPLFFILWMSKCLLKRSSITLLGSSDCSVAFLGYPSTAIGL